jgi:hypothetical protein
MLVVVDDVGTKTDVEGEGKEKGFFVVVQLK